MIGGLNQGKGCLPVRSTANADAVAAKGLLLLSVEEVERCGRSARERERERERETDGGNDRRARRRREPVCLGGQRAESRKQTS